MFTLPVHSYLTNISYSSPKKEIHNIHIYNIIILYHLVGKQLICDPSDANVIISNHCYYYVYFFQHEAGSAQSFLGGIDPQ